jgi:drug/metabolite transporter (DMT)-like permease
MLRLGIPLVFVLIWSTGFIVAKAVLPHADLQLFLVARFTLTGIVMGCAALFAGAQWPGVRQDDAPWGGDESDGAAAAGSSASRGSGVSVFR